MLKIGICFGKEASQQKSYGIIPMQVFKMSLIAILALFLTTAFSNPNEKTELSELGVEFTDCGDCPPMITVPEGEYSMGMPPVFQGRPYDKGEMRRIVIERAFALGKFEVTFDQWAVCVKDGRCEELDDRGWGRGDRPVINVSWRQAVKYTKWLSKKTKKTYRLPSEAEWEYAGRAGAGRARFFGVDLERVCEYGNVYDESAKVELEYGWEALPCQDAFVDTAPVGSFLPNEFGLYDMLGNVWEWTADCLSDTFRPTNGVSRDAVVRGDCSQRAFRGGSWLNHPSSYIGPEDRYKFIEAKEADLGFRVARDLP